MHDATRGNTIVDIVLLTRAQEQYRGTKKYFLYILKHFYNLSQQVYTAISRFRLSKKEVKSACDHLER